MMRSAVFLDRDGVINLDREYVCEPEDFEWMPGAIDAIRALNDAGHLTVIVTNQSGIGRGYYTEAKFRALHRWIDEQLSECGARIDAVYFCPHLPDAPVSEYRLDCNCRKPRPGMLQTAMDDLGIGAANSFLVGDRQTDRAAANAAGVRFHMFRGPDLSQFIGDLLRTTACQPALAGLPPVTTRTSG